ncbi:hypothetical protein HKT18_07120 [Flavobacterium sp. IMCC34852]|uniref:DUF4595 domain-containing protein n=1 Tax=Flavobacterium rivulicola TaxID=2732161 RepID=A0A7Y3R8T0_9FLAO|nr:hypothetical protein [Flavobacterium sp. IMCC34852]NNT71982.1 hypothetical protein [Flavobacterium sp. IMCC34852]
MKKFFQYLAFLWVVVLTMTSCTTDDNSGTSAILLKKLTAVSFGTNAEYNFTYKGTKLSQVTFTVNNQTNGNGYYKYTYTNDLITEISRYHSNGHLSEKTTFSYDSSNRLTEALKLVFETSFGSKKVFSHNLNGTVTVTTFGGNLIAQNTLSDIVETYHFTNGEISQKDYDSNTLAYSINYAYDNANHPTQNVTGLKALKLYDFISDGLFGMNHNLLEQNTYDANGNLEHTVSYQGDYNQDNYPTALYTADGQFQYQFTYFK